MPTVHAAPLPKPQRTQLENTVKAARDVAEKGARAALEQLAVGEGRAPDYLSEDKKALRRRLRAHGRALGDVKALDDTQGLQCLVWEVAYEHWHRMLFARFLAENGLLMWEVGAAVSLDDCEALVQETDPSMNLGAKTKWELAGKLAARMLPQVFKPQSPVFELALAPEHQRELERLLAGLAPEVFQASDSLGWVYQFWQAKRKDEVNKAEIPIGADELPAVTQLFTEPYMVDFLLHNSLGAWWVTRHPGKTCPVPLTYLRTLEDGTPAAGKFEGWPDRLEGFKLLDPCCGSGHFLVAAFLLLVPIRMAAEGLSTVDAVDAVLADNIHGLELDARCVEIAVFALALAAWRFPDANGEPLGVRAEMPAPQVACCGLKVAAKLEDWMALVPDDAANAAYLRQELRVLHASFAQAPLLGSLLDPRKSLKNDLATSDLGILRELLESALSIKPQASLGSFLNDSKDETWDHALAARDLLHAARLLGSRYHLVVTNPPYLVRGKQSDELRAFVGRNYPSTEADIATVFIERFSDFLDAGGIHASVTPLNWYYLKSYQALRESLLSESTTRLAAKVGSGATAKASWDVLRALAIVEKTAATATARVVGIEAPAAGEAERSEQLRTGPIQVSTVAAIRNAPDCKFVFGMDDSPQRLEDYAWSYQGLATGDFGRYGRKFFELPTVCAAWELQHSTFPEGSDFVGLEHVLHWENGRGALASSPSARIQGMGALNKVGVVVTQTRALPATLYLGTFFDNNVAVIVPKNSEDLPAIWAYCSSPEYHVNVRKLDEKLGVTNATLAKVPFDLSRWQKVATKFYPNGLPKPYSDDSTQWLFHGHPRPAADPLQVAVARLVGYHWPAEQEAAAAAENQAKLASSGYLESASSYQNESIEVANATPQRAPIVLSEAAHAWIARCAQLDAHTDDDGIVCLPSVRGETPAHERLLKLLIAAWESAEPGSWRPAVLDKLLADADCVGKGLDVWLRDKFFEQHAKRFHHRPFVWHVWDGLKDGFAALVNYHRLDAKNLERLIHTYLGDWIRQQEAGVQNGVDGAPIRLAAAQDLKRRLELILEGEPPYDIFVRWKPLTEQPIGWNPDLNDGVRLNIRPFMTAEVLRHNKKPKLNITWDKDRGKDVESAPWFGVFGGDRINDHHLTLAEKKAAQKNA